tara:strand:- start:243 stop:767 length:525 start_codon:yes stop_codon:yes gene_type:complete
MKQIIEKLRTSTLSKWQNVALDILGKSFNECSVAHYEKCITNDCKEIESINFNEFLELCRKQFLIVKSQIGENLLTENWGEWLNTRIFFSLTQKQYDLISRNLRSSDITNCNLNQSLLNDDLNLFGDCYMRFEPCSYDIVPKSTFRGDKAVYIQGFVYYTRNHKTKYTTIAKTK